MIAISQPVWSEQLPLLFKQLAPNQQKEPAFRETQARIWQLTPNTGIVVETYPTDCENGSRLADCVERRAYAALMTLAT
jgi:hypothetical protein